MIHKVIVIDVPGTVNRMLMQAINGGSTLICFNVGNDYFKVNAFQKKPAKWIEMAEIPVSEAKAIFSHIKTLAGLNKKDCVRLSIGEFSFRLVPWTKSSRRGDGEIRKIRVVSYPSSTPGEDEVIIDLMPKL